MMRDKKIFCVFSFFINILLHFFFKAIKPFDTFFFSSVIRTESFFLFGQKQKKKEEKRKKCCIMIRPVDRWISNEKHWQSEGERDGLNWFRSIACFDTIDKLNYMSFFPYFFFFLLIIGQQNRNKNKTKSCQHFIRAFLVCIILFFFRFFFIFFLVVVSSFQFFRHW